MIGRVVSHYKILEHLGGGGMGVIYKAEDLRLKRTVALKFLPDEFSTDSKAAARLIREAQATSALQHENICVVHDIDRSEDGRLFICMDFYDGETLKKKISRGTLPFDEVLSYVRQIARGLSKAHAAEIIHRDLKPDNIMVTSDGVVKIVDFGIAKLLRQTRITQDGPTLGTIAYMPPEQVRGEDVDLRADVWSLGVVLFEMLTQKLPFRGDSVAAMTYTITNEPPFDVGDFRKDVPEVFRRLCRECLSKARGHRPGSMEKILTILGESAPAVKRFNLLRRVRTSRRWSIGVGAALAGILAVVLTVQQLGESPVRENVPASFGILEFTNQTGDPHVRLWPQVIQALFFQGLAGTDGMAVLDPASFNRILESSFGPGKPAEARTVYALARGSAAQFIIDGSIVSTPLLYRLHMRIIRLQSEEVLYAGAAWVNDRDDLESSVDSLCQQVVDFVRLQVLSPGERQDLKPWLPPRRQNLASLNAFLTATDFKYRGDTNATRYLREAITLDSTFISPRVWLISDLLQSGHREEAEHHAHYLAGLSKSVRPFDQAMIQWAEACVAGDTSAQITHLRTALGFSPGNNILLYNLARLIYARGDYAGVIQMLRPASEVRWPYSRMYFLLGASYIQLNDQQKAREILESSFVMTPVFPEIYRLLVLLYDSSGDTTMANRYQRTFVTREQERGISRSTSLVSLARSSTSWGLYAEARGRYMAAMELSPESLTYRRELADMLVLAGDTLQAVHEYLEVRRLDSARAAGVQERLQRLRR